MTAADDEMSLALDGRAAPPLANGEVVFEAPWQSRVFGMARALCEQGLFEWDDFRQCLIAEIEQYDQSHPEGEGYQYFDHFLNALASLLAQRELCAASELADRTLEFAQRPHGHDH